jgi:hypothetical protein
MWGLRAHEAVAFSRAGRKRSLETEMDRAAPSRFQAWALGGKKGRRG